MEKDSSAVVDGGRPKVLLLGIIEHAHIAWQSIADIAEVVKPKAKSREEFIDECKSGSLDGISVAYRTFDSFQTTGRIDAEVVSVLPESLRYICHNGAGYDQIDIPACTERSILVSNTPTAVDDSTADLNIWLMLGAMRNLHVPLMALRAGDWRGKPSPPLGHDPQEKILGILGMGGIGLNMAKKAMGFGMKIRYYNRSRREDAEKECGAEYVDFDTLLGESDVLSINVPLNTKTRHLISTAEFAKMKRGIIIVNTARGAIMDEAALVEALDDGIVSTVGLDVYENEPTIHPGLMANNKVLLVPHMGTWTVETQTKMEAWTISNVKMAVVENRLRSIVPEQKHLV